MFELDYRFIARGIARDEFEKAYDQGDADPRMCLRLALLERETGRPLGRAIPPLERALQARPI